MKGWWRAAGIALAGREPWLCRWLACAGGQSLPHAAANDMAPLQVTSTRPSSPPTPTPTRSPRPLSHGPLPLLVLCVSRFVLCMYARLPDPPLHTYIQHIASTLSELSFPAACHCMTLQCHSGRCTGTAPSCREAERAQRERCCGHSWAQTVSKCKFTVQLTLPKPCGSTSIVHCPANLPHPPHKVAASATLASPLSTDEHLPSSGNLAMAKTRPSCSRRRLMLKHSMVR